MKKEIRTVDKEKGIIQVTTVDERWYIRTVEDPITKLPILEYVPSVTWIAEHYPKGIGFYKWLANTGWDESQALKEAAGDKGSKVHLAIVDLLDGLSVDMGALYKNPSTEQPEALTLDEYQAILSFAKWFEAEKPETLGREMVVWNNEEKYAGTVDYLCRIGDELYVIDFKTSKSIWPSHILQISAYKHAVKSWDGAKLAILQLGYERNKLGYKFTEVEDDYPLFLASKKIWSKETEGQKPLQKDYPVRITLQQAKAETQPIAQVSQSNDVSATPQKGENDGTIRRLGKEKLQDNSIGGRRKRGGSLSRV